MCRSRLALKIGGPIEDRQTRRATLADPGDLNRLRRYDFSKSATLAKKPVFLCFFLKILTLIGHSSGSICVKRSTVTPPDRGFSAESIPAPQTVYLTENSGASAGKPEKN